MSALHADDAARGGLADLGTPQAAEAALKVFFRICESQWHLDAEAQQALLGVSRSQFYAMRQQAPKALSRELQERLSYVLRIFASLRILFPQDDRTRQAWVHAPNAAPLFGGRTALSVMTEGWTGSLCRVADYLDACRGGEFA